MKVELGHVNGLVRYSVKSMAGTEVGSALLGWHGLDGDRCFAFRRLGDEGGFPWLSSSRLPDHLRNRPVGLDPSAKEPLPTQVLNPTGAILGLRSGELRDEIPNLAWRSEDAASPLPAECLGTR